MKKLLIIVLFMITSSAIGQGWKQYYDMPNITTQFGIAIPVGQLVFIRDSSAMYKITHLMQKTDNMSTVFTNSWYVKLGAVSGASLWQNLGGAIVPLDTTLPVAVKKGFSIMPGDGDVNNSGTLSAADALYLQLYILGAIELSGKQKARGDVNGDGLISMSDVSIISGRVSNPAGNYSVDSTRYFLGKTLFTHSAGKVKLANTDLFNSGTDAFDVETGGNVRIPTTFPLYFGATSYTTSADSVVKIWSPAFTKLSMDAGAVGIGVSNPTEKLEVNGKTKTTLLQVGAYNVSVTDDCVIPSTASGMVYPGAGIPLSTGSAWGTSITNSSANWNTAYGWGNHASAGYMTNPMRSIGDIIYGTTDGVPERLAIGTGGKVLTAIEGIPSWQTPTTYSAGYGLQLASGAFKNIRYQKDIDTVRTTLTGLVKATAGVLSAVADNSSNWNTAYGWGAWHDNQNLVYSNRAITPTNGLGTLIPRFSTTDTVSGLVKGSANVGSTYFLNGVGNWAIPPDNNTTYTAGFGLVLNSTAFGNTRYWKNQDSLKTTLSGIVISTSGLLSAITDGSANWNTAYGWGNHAGLYVPVARTITTTAPITGGGALSSNLTIAIPVATTSANGYLSSADWNTFNSKAGANYWTEQAGSTNNAYFSKSGNVGIGTSSPGYTLSIASAGDRAISVNNSTATGDGIYSLTGSSTGSAIYGQGGTTGVKGTGVRGVEGTGTETGVIGLGGSSYGGSFTSTSGGYGLYTTSPLKIGSYNVSVTEDCSIPLGTGVYVPVARTISTTAPITGGGDLSADRTIAMPMATADVNGYLSSANWTTFNSKGSGTVTSVATGLGLSGGTITSTGTLLVDTSNAQILSRLRASHEYQPKGTYVTSVSGTAPVVSSGGTAPAISMAAANTSTNGYLTSTDWNTFNNKSIVSLDSNAWRFHGGSGGVQIKVGNAHAPGAGSVASGAGSVASGNYSHAFGASSTASGANAVTFGAVSTASGDNSLALGNQSVASSTYAVALGGLSTASGENSTALGSSITVSGSNSFGVSLSNTASTITASNIMSVMGGKVGIGNIAPDSTLHVTGDLHISEMARIDSNALVGVSIAANARIPGDRLYSGINAYSNLAARSLVGIIDFLGTSNTAFTYNGLNGLAYTNATSTGNLTSTNVAGALRNKFLVAHSGSGTLVTMTGVDAVVSQGGGTCTNGILFQGEKVTVASGKTMTNAYGLMLRGGSVVGTLTNHYGIYIEDMVSGSTNRYSIYQAGSTDKNYFGGNTGIGTATPTAKLHVALGNINVNQSGGDSVSISSGKGIRLYGNATVWDDLIFPFVSSDHGSATCPTNVVDSCYHTFSVDTVAAEGVCKMYFTIQLPHSWKEASTVYPHVHYKHETGIGTPKFILKYKWYALGGSTAKGWKWYKMETTTATTDKTVQIVSGSTGISGSGMGISSIIIAELYLSGTPDNVNAYQFDIHYEKDSEGSSTETAK